METALVFDVGGAPLYWHEPPGRSGAHIPDSRDLWDVLWEHRQVLGGVAHTHPWNGPSVPSQSDLTTFAAVEAGLGKRLLWPIVTFSEHTAFVWNPVCQTYVRAGEITFPYWIWSSNIQRLREKSSCPSET